MKALLAGRKETLAASKLKSSDVNAGGGAYVFQEEISAAYYKYWCKKYGASRTKKANKQTEKHKQAAMSIRNSVSTFLVYLGATRFEGTQIPLSLQGVIDDTYFNYGFPQNANENVSVKTKDGKQKHLQQEQGGQLDHLSVAPLTNFNAEGKQFKCFGSCITISQTKL